MIKMKPKRMHLNNTKGILLVLIFASLYLLGCEKAENDFNDLAAKISGTYYGDYTYTGAGVYKAEIRLTRLSDSTVTLSATVAGDHRYDITVKLSEGANELIYLFRENFTLDLYGVVDGNQLSYTYGNTNQFVGTKP